MKSRRSGTVTNGSLHFRKILKCLGFLMSIALLPSTIRAADSVITKTPQTITIIAVESSSHSELQGARVFVLGESGRELAATTTDAHRRATLSVPILDDRPKYVFVAHPHYFISGTKWLGAGESTSSRRCWKFGSTTH